MRNIIFFTIGGNMGITVLENLTEELREYWPQFEGFYCVYHEGIFSTYKEKGITGINLPFVDFYWKDSVLAPEYREQTLADDDALFEKCTIYDGGARRYEIPEHYHEVMEYWEKLDEPKIGCLVLIRTEPKLWANHVGIYIGDGRFIHAYLMAGVCVSTIKRWKSHIVGYYYPRK